MKFTTFLFLGILLLSSTAWAEGKRYEMRVDGLACPYCAYGIEKKLLAIQGVSNLDIDLDKGVVSVNAPDGVELTKKQMTQLFDDAGFSLRGMKVTDVMPPPPRKKRNSHDTPL